MPQDIWGSYIKPLLDGIGYAITFFGAASFIFLIYAWLKGLIPAIKRLGLGLSRRKIAVFANSEHYNGLSSMLVESGLFSSKNIIQVCEEKDLESAQDITLHLIYWPDWGDKLEKILTIKKAQSGVTVYCPPDSEPISQANKNLLDKYKNVAVANFRGRLLGDIVVMMITTEPSNK